MCEFYSGWLKRDGDLLTSDTVDSHRQILLIHGIKGRNGRLTDLMVPFEFSAPKNADPCDPAAYVFAFHETPRPEWATDEKIERATGRLRDLVSRCIVRENRTILCGGKWIVASGVKIGEVTEGTVIAANYGHVAANWGHVAENYSGGHVAANYSGGTVAENYGTVAVNYYYGTVAANYGTVAENYGTVAVNYYYGTVAANYYYGTVATNYGTVAVNRGNVAANWGEIGSDHNKKAAP